MTDHECACGHAAASAEDLADHLGEQFIPPDDTASDGQRHAELVRPGGDGTLWECQCGFATVQMRALDAHLLLVFTPPDAVGPDGRVHAPVTAPAPGDFREVAG
jgi:hypothetical protein